MTDDRLEKVRAEIERRLRLLVPKMTFQHQRKELENILSFIDSMQEEPKFKIGQTITDPEDSTFTFHINKIEDGKYIESDDALVLIKDADEEYQLVEEPVSEELEEAAIENARFERGDDTEASYDINRYEGFIDGSNWQKEQFEKNRLKHCDSITNEQAELEQGFIDQHLDKHQRMPTFLDAIEYGMKLMKEQMMKSAVECYIGANKEMTHKLLCFSPRGQKIALDDALSEIRIGDKVRVIIIKEE